MAEKKVDCGCGTGDQVPSEEAIKEKSRQETAEKSPSTM